MLDALLLILAGGAVAVPALAAWRGSPAGWLHTRFRTNGWFPLAVLFLGLAVVFVGFATLLAELAAPRIFAGLLMVLVGGSVVLALVTGLRGIPESYLPAWIRTRLDAGDRARIPDLPEPLWGRGIDDDSRTGILRLTSAPSSAAVAGLLGEVRAGVPARFAVDRSSYWRTAVLFGAAAGIVAALGAAMLLGGESSTAGVGLLVGAAALAVFASGPVREAAGGGEVLVTDETLTVRNWTVRWEDVGAVVMKMGLGRTKVTVVPSPAGAEGVPRNHGEEPVVVLPAVRENAWVVGELLERLRNGRPNGQARDARGRVKSDDGLVLLDVGRSSAANVTHPREAKAKRRFLDREF
nr:hypothetical protein [Actinomycetales bacterium]